MALQAAVNIDDSVARMGFCGSSGSSVWVTTGTEELHVWDWFAAVQEGSEGGDRRCCSSDHAASVSNILLRSDHLHFSGRGHGDDFKQTSKGEADGAVTRIARGAD